MPLLLVENWLPAMQHKMTQHMFAASPGCLAASARQKHVAADEWFCICAWQLCYYSSPDPGTVTLCHIRWHKMFGCGAEP
jgi:hypothetical protein